jgi:hypothetical protein
MAKKCWLCQANLWVQHYLRQINAPLEQLDLTKMSGVFSVGLVFALIV